MTKEDRRVSEIAEEQLGEQICHECTATQPGPADEATERLVAGCEDEAERLQRLAGASH